MAKEPELTRTTIVDASTKELRLFAETAAGLEFPADAGRDFIIREIFEALEWDAYAPDEGATHVVVNLPVTATEKNPYQGGCNGKMFTIQRGEDVEIPIGYYNTMVEAAAMRYKIESVPKTGKIEEGSPASRRIPLGGLDMTVVKFLNKGSQKPAPSKPKAAPKAESKAEEATTN